MEDREGAPGRNGPTSHPWERVAAVWGISCGPAYHGRLADLRLPKRNKCRNAFRQLDAQPDREGTMVRGRVVCIYVAIGWRKCRLNSEK